MNPEQHATHEESVEALLLREIRTALSPAWPKSIQELLPGYLPDKPYSECSPDELDLYRTAYKIAGELVDLGEAEVLFEEHVPEDESQHIEHETIARAKFKKSISGGTKERSHTLGLGTELGLES